MLSSWPFGTGNSRHYEELFDLLEQSPTRPFGTGNSLPSEKIYYALISAIGQIGQLWSIMSQLTSSALISPQVLVKISQYPMTEFALKFSDFKKLDKSEP